MRTPVTRANVAPHVFALQEHVESCHSRYQEIGNVAAQGVPGAESFAHNVKSSAHFYI